MFHWKCIFLNKKRKKNIRKVLKEDVISVLIGINIIEIARKLLIIL